MKEERGFFVKYGDCFYSQAFQTLNEARRDAKEYAPKKLKIYHGILKKINDQIVDDSKLFLVPRIGGYKNEKSSDSTPSPL